MGFAHRPELCVPARMHVCPACSPEHFSTLWLRRGGKMSYFKYGRETEFEPWSSADMRKKAIVYDSRDIGKLSICSNETLQHFLAKSILVYELLRLKHMVVCEAKLQDIGSMDVYDITCKVDYEIETEKSLANSLRFKEKYRQIGVDLVIIQIHGLSPDLNTMKDHVCSFIRPD